ncbi:MAG: ABC transporter permease [Eubacteriales bacterium]|nr:ABC transporter permease [Eubacteriales bacterium]
MKRGLYFSLAGDGIRKNKRLYLPYILTCIGMVMMYYIILFLQLDPMISAVPFGGNAQLCLFLGGWIIAVFSCLFLFYTNSFLIRRRKQEFGLYNILGMGKKHVCRVLFYESLIVAVISIVSGLVVGTVFSKLAELGMIYILEQPVDFTFKLSIQAVGQTILVFIAIFILLYLNNIRQIYSQTTLSLLGSEKAGEKPPKANWIPGLAGAVILGWAYFIAVTIENPVAALVNFFFAVILVIIGTYLLMISGSVLFCRILQKNKNYYYKKNHFISVSSMAYRMKRNGAGLASICILSTMVLVMISSSSCLYFGLDDALKGHYPSSINLTLYAEGPEGVSDEKLNTLAVFNENFAASRGVRIKQKEMNRSASIAGFFADGVFETNQSDTNSRLMLDGSNIVMVHFMPVGDLNRASGKGFTLSDDEVLLFADNRGYEMEMLNVANVKSYKVKENLSEDYMGFSDSKDVVDSVYVFVNSLDTSLKGLEVLTNEGGSNELQYNISTGFDLDITPEEQIAFFNDYKKVYYDAGLGFASESITSREYFRGEFLVTFGGLFYLGIILSIVFILAATLIIYYKQVSEGYEDQSRFEIMQKVGMTGREIRQSINSQILTVFALPLLMAGIHVCFAFPVIKQMLALFGLHNVKLFVGTSVISFVIFAVLYVFVYRVTSNAYFNIVSAER